MANLLDASVGRYHSLEEYALVDRLMSVDYLSSRYDIPEEYPGARNEIARGDILKVRAFYFDRSKRPGFHGQLNLKVESLYSGILRGFVSSVDVELPENSIHYHSLSLVMVFGVAEKPHEVRGQMIFVF